MEDVCEMFNEKVEYAEEKCCIYVQSNWTRVDLVPGIYILYVLHSIKKM